MIIVPIDGYAASARNLITNTASFSSVEGSKTNTLQASTTVTIVPTTGTTKAQIQFMQLNKSLSLVPATAYHEGDTVWVLVNDPDQNLYANSVETINVTLTDDLTGDSEQVTLTETGANTGIFVASIVSRESGTAVANDGYIQVTKGSRLTATYTDTINGGDVATSAIMIDPYGIIFDSVNGTPINGVTVTIIDVTTGLPASVFGDDGVTPFPSSVVSGGSATDASGTVYNFAPGTYRFPYVLPGTYRLQLSPPSGYAYPTQLTDAQIQTAPGGPYSLVPGSRGENFVINPGPAMHIDIPMDPLASTLFLRKQASTAVAAQGDFVSYTLTLQNNSTLLSTAGSVIIDTLPQGFRFVSGSAKLGGAPITPTIGSDGRTLTFNTGAVGVSSAITLTYATEVTVGAPLNREAVNTANATGTQGSSTVNANTATAKVMVKSDFMLDKNLLAGRVFVDKADPLLESGQPLNPRKGAALNDKGEVGVPDVRVYLEDGTYVVTDKNGMFHFENVKPGVHVVQLDLDSLPARYEAVPLPNTRFAGRAFSQFVDLQPGTLWRTNFRLAERPAPSTPVTVEQNIEKDDGDGNFTVTLKVKHDPKITLNKLALLYSAPEGWQVLNNTAVVDGTAHAPEQSMLGTSWTLDPAKAEHRVRFEVRPGGKSGDKPSIAYARFSSAGTPRGRTELAKTMVEDRFEEHQLLREINFTTTFSSFSDKLNAVDIEKLNQIASELRGLEIKLIYAIGYTDNKPIRARSKYIYANNTELSKGRALAVLKYLQKVLDLPPDALVPAGKGPLDPIADNNTVEGRRLNRRVVLRVYANEYQRDNRSKVVVPQAEAKGVAAESWDKGEAKKTLVSDTHVKQVGILSLTDGTLIPVAINTVRVALPTKLKPRLKVDGVEIPVDRIGFKLADPSTGNTLYSYIGIDFGKEGNHTVTLEGIGPFGNTRFSKQITVHRTGGIAAIRLVDEGNNVADGKTPVRIRVKLFDSAGRVIKVPTTLDIVSGDLLPYHRPDEGTLALSNTDDRKVAVGSDGWIAFAPTQQTGTHDMVLGVGDLQTRVSTYVKPEYRDWILVGLAEGTVGYNTVKGKAVALDGTTTDDKLFQNGRLAFYAKGKILGKWLLTAAYDSSKDQVYDKNLTGAIDPNRYYTLYGDTTAQQADAPSSRKLYLKIERDAFYALFGDFTTGLTVTELSKYSRTLTGIKSEYHGQHFGYNAFASQTSQTMVHDEIAADGTAGLYQLSRQNIMANTDQIVIETRDRFNSQNIISRVQLQRYIDYYIDYDTGSIYFKAPIPTRDENFNPVYIVADYEADNPGQDQLLTAGGRAYIKPSENSEIGVTAVNEQTLGKANTLTGADASIDVGVNTKLKAEVAQSSGQGKKDAKAWLLEGSYIGKGLSGKAYYREVQDDFGLGQMQGTENATRKYGLDGSYSVDQSVSINAQAEHQEYLDTGATRDKIGTAATLNGPAGNVSAGLQHVGDVDGAGQHLTSDMVTLGGSYKANDRLTLRASHEQLLNTGNNSPDYPTRSLVGVDYLINPHNTLFAEREYTSGDAQDTTMDRIGLRGNAWNGASYYTNYEQQFNENGPRAVAGVGLNQKWDITKHWSVDASIDRSYTLQHPGTNSLSTNVPLASGSSTDFTATSLGAKYATGFWEFNARLDARIADNENKYGRYASLIGDLTPHLSAMSRVISTRTEYAGGTVADSGTVTMGLAWRPDYDGFMWFNRLDVKYDESIGGVSTTKNWRYINNLNLNWQYSRNLQLAIQWGIKYAVDTIDGTPYTGLTDLYGVQGAWDFRNRWDIEGHARTLVSHNQNQSRQNYGVGIGYNVAENVWMSLGYNFAGFWDPDFSASEFTAQGPYLRLRVKFDQNNLRGFLKGQ